MHPGFVILENVQAIKKQTKKNLLIEKPCHCWTYPYQLKQLQIIIQPPQTRKVDIRCNGYITSSLSSYEDMTVTLEVGKTELIRPHDLFPLPQSQPFSPKQIFGRLFPLSLTIDWLRLNNPNVFCSLCIVSILLKLNHVENVMTLTVLPQHCHKFCCWFYLIWFCQTVISDHDNLRFFFPTTFSLKRWCITFVLPELIIWPFWNRVISFP